MSTAWETSLSLEPLGALVALSSQAVRASAQANIRMNCRFIVSPCIGAKPNKDKNTNFVPNLAV